MANWLILGIIALILLSISRILQRIMMRGTDTNPLAYSIVFQIIVGFFFLILGIWQGFDLNPFLPFWKNIILGTILYSFGSYFMMAAFKLNHASIAAISFATVSIWTVITSIIFLGETLDRMKIIAVILILLSVIIASIPSKIDIVGINKKGVVYSLFAAFFMGTAFTNDIYIIGKSEPFSFLFLAFLLPALVQFIFLKNKVKEIEKIIEPGHLLKVAVFSLFYGGAVAIVPVAKQMDGLISVLAPLQQVSVVLTIIFAAIFLKERDGLIKKLIGGLLCIVAVGLIAI